MKKVLLMMLIIILGLPLLAQEISFPSTVVAAGGSSADGNSVSFSRWRIGQIHVLSLPDEVTMKEKIMDMDWNVTVYPNPVEDVLYLEFELPESKELFLKITDIAGRVLFIQEARPFVIGGSTVELDMFNYYPALYMLQISSPDLTSQKVYRIQKL